jgi:hypothetical protein
MMIIIIITRLKKMSKSPQVYPHIKRHNLFILLISLTLSFTGKYDHHLNGEAV